MLICLDFALGFVTLAFVPFNRPSGWLPHKGEVIYLVHAALGALLVVGATALQIRSRDSTRTVRLSGRVGFAGLLLAAAGGLMADDQSLVRFVGMTLMLVGPALSVFCYLIPTMSASSRRLAASGG
jgi:cyanate permease